MELVKASLTQVPPEHAYSKTNFQHSKSEILQSGNTQQKVSANSALLSFFETPLVRNVKAKTVP